MFIDINKQSDLFSSMFKLFRRILCLVALCFLIFCLFSCKKSQTAELFNREQRFKLEYGSFENELNLFDISTNGDVQTFVVMQDGFIYISNGKAKKVMQFTSYGDLLRIFYNPDTNPVPSFMLSENIYGTKQSTQSAVSYKFNMPGALAVDSEKNLYVIDRLPLDRQEQDLENNLLLRDVVLRFNSDGTFIDYLGQHGPGGIPFSYIENIYTTLNNELVVSCLTNTGYAVYWFNKEGFLLYNAQLSADSIPLVEDKNECFVSLDKVVPDYKEHTLYIKADYFLSDIDVQSGVQTGVSYEGSYLYTLNLDTEKYEEPLSIPGYEAASSESAEKTVYTRSLDFLGVTDSGWFFFMTPVEGGYVVEIIQKNGQKLIKKILSVSDDELVFNNFSLSKDGIITAILANEIEASVVWWRTDAVIDALIK